MTTEQATFAPHPNHEHTTTSRKLRARSLGRADAASDAEVVQLRLKNDAEEPYDRPRSRGDCASGPRPCPFVGCKHNLYLEYSKETGNIRLNFPDREPHQMPVDGSCSLDVAEQGGVTLNAAGEYINLTRERIRQMENAALRKLRSPPTMGRKGNALSEGVAGLRAYAGHESHSAYSPLGEQMVDSSSDTAAPEEDDDDARRFKPSLPRFLDEDVSHKEYCESLHRIWDDWRTDRQALSNGDLHVVRGHYVTAKHVKVIEAIRVSWRERGHPPSILEVAEAAEVKGSTESTRRQNASAILRSLRELGLLEGKRGELRVVEETPVPAAPAEAEPVIPEPISDAAQERTQEAAE